MAFHDLRCAGLIYSQVFCSCHEAFNSLTRGHMDFQLALCLLQVSSCVHAWRQITARTRSCSERYAVLLTFIFVDTGPSTVKCIFFSLEQLEGLWWTEYHCTGFYPSIFRLHLSLSFYLCSQSYYTRWFKYDRD
jgi:hypothetical protein